MVLVFMIIGSAIGYLIASQITGIDFMSNPEFFSDYSNPSVIAALKIIQLFSTVGGFLLPAIYFPKAIYESTLPFNKANNYGTPMGWVLSIALIIIATPILSSLVLWNEGIRLPASWADVEQKLRMAEDTALALTEVFLKGDSMGTYFFNLLVVAVAPAICEEFLFRGALMQFLLKCFNNMHIAVWVSALAFSLFHGQFYGFFPRLLIGVFLAYSVIYSRSIWPAIAAHFINNGLAVSASFFKWNESSYRWLHDDYVFDLGWVIVSMILTQSILVWMVNNIKKQYASRLDENI
jgi:membrane protease YdiL (CAAX protease family)